MTLRGVPTFQGPSNAAGLNQYLDRLCDELAAYIVEQIDTFVAASGPPWRSQKLPRREMVARILEWNTPSPAVQQQVAGMDLEEVLKAALEAVKVLREAEKRGEYTPPYLGLGAPMPAQQQQPIETARLLPDVPMEPGEASVVRP